ncbi:hypothetical protein WNX13_10210, partial [Lactobacillus delbrueckii]|uniref:hypothetical protein n=1 Tax=Lactobacillus delbrueckii TaxID=1584 RepID=UPI0030E9B885
DGVTGKEIHRAQVPNSTLSVGPFNGHFGIAYLDGVNPSIYFSGKNRNPNKSFNMEVSAWTWRNGGLVKNWTWVRNNQPCPDGHNIRA